ncbi:MAG: ribose-phosphate pyrophosphokinase [Chaenotheca gracillima]|nr:MAG: ribose-phosphate pyrophosphokinase [Chaenotheca gracillima]
MTLFILAETSAGYALLKAKDKKLLQRDDLAAETESADGICSLLKLKQFQKFDSAVTALDEVSALVEGKVSPMLSNLLSSLKDEKKVSLAVADPKLGTAINKLPSLSLTPIVDSTTGDLFRAIRNHLPSLIPGLMPQDISTMSLGLSHSLSRHKLKFSPDKVDTMIVHAIALLDDLDKELNTYAMRVKEWYGWHFPEMGRIVNDNLAYARVILTMGLRSNASTSDLAEVLPEEIETAVKAAAEVSMGTEITPEDLENIQALAEQVVGFTEYRQQLSGYLSARMNAIAPNLTTLVGELVGARLIAHAGSLMNLAKSPASTIQILGAEKALFRALKTKHDTPKYGLIYHASLIGQATGRNKGKIARMLATKSAIGLRVDALADWGTNSEGNGDDVAEEEKSALGRESRLKIERRLRSLEGKPLLPKGVAVAPNANLTPKGPGKWEVKEARKYNKDADGLAGDEPAAIALPITPTPEDKNSKKSKKEKKAKKDKEGDVKMIEEVADESEADSEDLDTSSKPLAVTNGTSPKFQDDRSETLRGESDEFSAEESKRSSKKSKSEQKEKKEKKKDKARKSEEEVHAEEAGLSIIRYQRKLERGEIKFGDDGKAYAVSKKDVKKAKKESKKDIEGGSSKKRKREEDGAEKADKSEKKKKKKHKA